MKRKSVGKKQTKRSRAKRRIVVLGAALSGPAAAARARETDARADIVLIGRAKAVSYSVGGLPYRLSGEVDGIGGLEPEKAKFFRDVYRIDVRTGATVTAIDPDAKRVITDAGKFRYDALIYALGARSVWPEVDGLRDSTNVSTLRDLADLKKIERSLDKGTGRVVILGGGFYGVEAADCLSRAGRLVTLIERGDRLLPDFSGAAAYRAEYALRAAGVDVRLGADLVSVRKKGKRIQGVELSSGSKIATELVLVTAGVAPRTELLKAAGGKLHPNGAAKIDARCQTTLPDVYATSIAVAHKHAVTGKATWTGQAADADKSAQVAGENAAGGDVRLGPTLGTAIVRAGVLTLARTGHLDPDAQVTTVSGRSKDPFFPSHGPLTVSLYSNDAGRLVGAEVVGTDGVDKRVDVLATAILGKLKVAQLADLDLAYSPPFGTVRDVVNAAARVASRGNEPIRPWTAQQLEVPPDGVLVVDVRSAADRSEGFTASHHIQQKVLLMPLAKVGDRIKDLRGHKHVVFVCDSGREAYLAARLALSARIKNPGYLAGGLRLFGPELHR